MNKSIKALSLVLSSAVLVTVSHAENIGVVEATKIMSDTLLGKQASDVINDKRLGYAKIAETRMKAINDKKEKARASASTMSEASRQKLALEISNLEQELELDNKKWMQDLQLEAQNEMEKLGKEFDKAVQKIAKETKADLIFEKESGRIVFAADHLNVTDSIKVAMNTEHKATQVASVKKDAAAPTTAKKATA